MWPLPQFSPEVALIDMRSLPPDTAALSYSFLRSDDVIEVQNTSPLAASLLDIEGVDEGASGHVLYNHAAGPRPRRVAALRIAVMLTSETLTVTLSDARSWDAVEPRVTRAISSTLDALANNPQAVVIDAIRLVEVGGTQSGAWEEDSIEAELEDILSAHIRPHVQVVRK